MKTAGSAGKIKYVRRFLRLIDGTVNFTVLVALIFLLCCGCYSIWDSKQVYREASAVEYEIYKPDEKSSISFEELCRINSDIFGWLTVYGTKIDYPLLQGEDNWEYLNKSCEGEYSLTGSIFLDYRNSKDFSDYNSIIHGHHMQASAMFGDLDKFDDHDFFSEHKYGSIYYGGHEHGLVFFAYAVADAYDDEIYSILASDSGTRQEYLDGLMSKSMYSRDCGQVQAEHIVLLSTCSSEMTNGRSILAGYISEDIYDDPFLDDEPDEPGLIKDADRISHSANTKKMPLWVRLLIILIMMILVYAVSDILHNQSCKKVGNTHEEHY